MHRDIKPVNLLLRHKGGSSFEGRVIDLGLALSFEDAIEECRASGRVLKGTTSFMPAVEGRTAKSSSRHGAPQEEETRGGGGGSAQL